MSADSNFKIPSNTGGDAARSLAGEKSEFEWKLLGEEYVAALSRGNLNSALEIQTTGT